MKVHHITYEVPYESLFEDPKQKWEIEKFFRALGFIEIPAEEPEPNDLVVRHWSDGEGVQIHLVEPKSMREGTPCSVVWGLGHFCVFVSRHRFNDLKLHDLCSRAREGSVRIWLEVPSCGLRAEVREYQMEDDLMEPEDEPTQTVALGENALRTSVPLTIEDRRHIAAQNSLYGVFHECLAIFNDRNRTHKDSWKREGLRGCLFNLRRKIERAWDGLFWSNDESKFMKADEDDLMDAINYAALAVLSLRDRNIIGTAGWWQADPSMRWPSDE